MKALDNRYGFPAPGLVIEADSDLLSTGAPVLTPIPLKPLYRVGYHEAVEVSFP